MGSRKSMAQMLLESTVGTVQVPNCTNVSTPLRRKSILPERTLRIGLSENDDEAERQARRSEISTTTTPPALNTSDRRRSLGLGTLAHMPASQMAERISQCIKLGAENKINPKNAFSLEIIDFMTYMIKKQDANMSNLQVASTSLDVSTKIYGFRVDSVHMEILRMFTGLEKHEKETVVDNSGMTEQQSTVGEGEDSKSEKRETKKRKRTRQTIFASESALRANVEIIKPSLMIMGEGDHQTTDMLYQASLPLHANSGFYQNQYNDVIVDTVDRTNVQDKDETVAIPRIEDFSELDICPPLSNFDFQNWNADDEPEESDESEIHNSEPEEGIDRGFQFDLDASLPFNDEAAPCSVNFFDIGNEEENVNKCTRRSNEVEKLVDFREVLTSSKSQNESEYSFLQKGVDIHWAGPSHWKINNFKKSFNNTKVVETCRQAPVRRRKEIELSYDTEVKESMAVKFQPSQLIKLQARTANSEWKEETLLLPPDEHYDIKQASKSYLHPLVSINFENKNDSNTAHLSDVVENYDYNNENDTSNYCPDVGNDDYPANEDNHDIVEDRYSTVCTPTSFTGDNLVTAPKLTNKIAIAYSLRAKKIDMMQLKKSLWKCLSSTRDKENRNLQDSREDEVGSKVVERKPVSEVYKTLPSELSKPNLDALSFPISFVSLLHIANEKTLKINSTPDMSDLIIEGD